MFRGKESIFVTVICAAGMGAFVALWLLDFTVVRISACEANETRGLCLRGWISALSGWAAAFAAVATIIFTIGPLRGQLRETKRQTDFSVGDAEPEIIVQRNRRKQLVSLLIVNWNRRRVIIESIKTTASMNGLAIHNTLPADDKYPSKKQLSKPRTKNGLYGIDGWRDRANPPDERTIALSFNDEGKFIDYPATSLTVIELEVSFRIIGQTHNRRSIVSRAIEIED